MDSTQTLLGLFDDWEDFCLYMFNYGMYVVVGVLLSAVMVFCCEMSCNRVFHQEEDADSDDDSKR
jgi:hypothetical protein